MVFKESLNETVGATPARLSIKQSPDGRAVSTITWATATRNASVTVWGNVMTPPPGSPYDKRWLMDIARGLRAPD